MSWRPHRRESAKLARMTHRLAQWLFRKRRRSLGEGESSFLFAGSFSRCRPFRDFWSPPPPTLSFSLSKICRRFPFASRREVFFIFCFVSGRAEKESARKWRERGRTTQQGRGNSRTAKIDLKKYHRAKAQCPFTKEKRNISNFYLDSRRGCQRRWWKQNGNPPLLSVRRTVIIRGTLLKISRYNPIT